MLLLCIFILVCSISISKKKYETYINPICLFFGANLVSIILMYATSIIDSNLSLRVCIMILVMLFMFGLGTLAGRQRFVLGSISLSSHHTVTSVRRLKQMILVYGIVFDIFAFYYLYLLNRSYGLRRMLIDFSGLNLAIHNGEVASGITVFFTPIGVALSLMILYYLKNYKSDPIFRALLILQYILCYIPCISPRRDMLFYMIIITFLFYLSQTKRRFEFKESTIKRIKSAFIAVGVLVATMWLLSYTQKLLNKSADVEFYIFGIKAPSFFKDPINYIAGNYSYLEKLNQEGLLNYSRFMISTLRLPYRYISNFLGLNIDTTTDFALDFINVGNGTSMLFNTAPMLYYFVKEVGMAFGVMYFIVGFISEKAFRAVKKTNSIGNIMLGLFQYCILLLSFRGYNLIYQSYLLILLYIWIAHKFIDVNEEIE